MSMSVFRRVLVPVEFASETKATDDRDDVFEIGPNRSVSLSPETTAAVQLAGKLASVFVELVHATPDVAALGLYGGAEGMWFPDQMVHDAEAAARDSTLKVLEQIGAALLPGRKVRGHAAAGGAARVILSFADELRADAIVLAASARGRLRRAFVGSTVNHIVRHSPCPVVVLPPTRD